MHKEIQIAFEEKFLSQSKFSSDVEKLVKIGNLTYIEAIVHYCEENNIDVTSVSKLVSKPLKERLKCEAIELNFLKRNSRAKLPL